LRSRAKSEKTEEKRSVAESKTMTHKLKGGIKAMENTSFRVSCRVENDDA
jgi:prophage tail gpP-like protein